MIFRNSRYTSTRLAVDDGVTTFEKRVIPNFNKNRCIKHTVIQGETLDLIAQKYYENPKLWWAILDANIRDMKDYFACLEPGTKLNIPPLDDIQEVINNE